MLPVTRQAFRQTLRSYFAEQLPGWSDEVADTDPLDSYGLDSTGIAILILYLEETFEIQVLDEDLTARNLGSVQGILDFLDRKKSPV